MYCFECHFESRDDSRVCLHCGKPLSTDADAYFKAGMGAVSTGDCERAIALLRDATLLYPGHLNARYNLGLALSLVGKCEESMEQYVEVARLDPNYPGIYTALGQSAFGSYMKHMEEAEWSRKAMFQLLMKAVEHDPDDVDAYFSIANAYIAVGNADQSLPWLRHALCLHPDSAAIYYTMAKALRMLKQYPEAAKMAGKSMELSTQEDPFRDEIVELLTELREHQAVAI